MHPRCGDCWLHIDAPSGLRASINLGQRGSMNDNIIVGRTIRITKNSQFQANTFTTEDVCQRCMKSLASIIADGIESLANTESEGVPAPSNRKQTDGNGTSLD